MRFKLTLRPLRPRQQLLFNYQYPLQAWIYKLLANSDADYATFLHEHGYGIPDSRKHFKHFTFSSLHIPQAEPIKKGDTYIGIRSEALTLFISFYMDKAAQDFIMGVFQDQELSLYNYDYRADFVVERIEAVAQPILSSSMVFRTLSPMVVASKTDSNDQYLSPTDADFNKYFALNLIDKYRSISPQDMPQLDAATAEKLVKFELLTEPAYIKKRGILVKEGKQDRQTKVIGYHNFTFRITAPIELITIGYYSGIGKLNAMGCGFVEVHSPSLHIDRGRG